MFLSTSSALCCPSWLIWEYIRVISAIFSRENSLNRCKRKDVGKDTLKLDRIRAIFGENIYLADLVIRILMELEDAVEGLQDLATDTHLRVPGLLLLLLLAEELRGEPGRDD